MFTYFLHIERIGLIQLSSLFLHPDMGVEVPHLIVELAILTPSPELLVKINASPSGFFNFYNTSQIRKGSL